MKKIPVNIYLRSILTVLAAALVLVAITSCGPKDSNKSRPLIFAQPQDVWWNAPVLLAMNSKMDVDIKAFSVVTGQASKDAVAQHHADIGVCANTPLLPAALKGQDVIVLGTFMRSSNLISIVRYTDVTNMWDHNIKIAITPGVISEFFLRKYLQANVPNVSFQDVNFLLGKPAEIGTHLKNKDAQVAVMFEPYTSDVLRPDFGTPLADVVQVLATNIYTVQSYLITSRTAWHDRRDDMLKVVRQVAMECAYVTTNSSGASDKVIKMMQQNTNSIAACWGQVDFSFVTDRASLRNAIMQDYYLNPEIQTAGTNSLLLDGMFEAITQIEGNLNTNGIPYK